MFELHLPQCFPIWPVYFSSEVVICGVWKNPVKMEPQSLGGMIFLGEFFGQTDHPRYADAAKRFHGMHRTSRYTYSGYSIYMVDICVSTRWTFVLCRRAYICFTTPEHEIPAAGRASVSTRFAIPGLRTGEHGHYGGLVRGRPPGATASSWYDRPTVWPARARFSASNVATPRGSVYGFPF